MTRRIKETQWGTRNGHFIETKQRIYSGPSISEVILDEILSEGVKNKILEYDQHVSSFIAVLNEVLPEDCRLDITNRIFNIKRKYKENGAYEDDGSTSTEGFDYIVIWSYTFGNPENHDADYIRNDMQEKCLYFQYEDSERIRDHKERRYHFFSMYLSGHRDTKHDDNQRIDYENENYQLGSILSRYNLAKVAIEIERIMKTQSIFNRIDEILSNKKASLNS